MTFTDTHLDVDRDVIFGLSGLQEYAPQFEWTSGQFVLPTQPNISKQEVPALVEQNPSDIVARPGGQPRRLYVCTNESAELFLVKVFSVKMHYNIPDWHCGLINEYADIFPAKIPGGLPTSRAVQFDV